ncbi:UNKNOWN [Stylonychia lemnae]|uniref:Uncharacterized protein n=1 Tax=Stylonychia lemnae TaxID=5949 RepID=A0A078AD77_STYLE|nr:UNKNOWN [Stylonychia lemnae]|eukprot:CDW80190.1 UNKNOWN [Stylonychia lemnae]
MRNLKILIEREKGIIQWQAIDEKIFIGHTTWLRITCLNTKYHFIFELTPKVQEKPQILQLSRVHYLFWLKNTSKILVYNFKNRSVEASIILPKHEGFITLYRVYQKLRKAFTYQLGLRGFKKINFYELDLNFYPQLKLIQSFDLLKPLRYICHSMMNNSYICNLLNPEQFDDTHQIIEIINRKDLSICHFQIQKGDHISMLNCKIFGDQIPLMIKYSDLALTMFSYKNGQLFNFELFKEFNEVNQRIVSSSTNLAIYTEELKSKYVVYILRKQSNGKGLLWRILIPRRVIANIFESLSIEKSEI